MDPWIILLLWLDLFNLPHPSIINPCLEYSIPSICLGPGETKSSVVVCNVHGLNKVQNFSGCHNFLQKYKILFVPLQCIVLISDIDICILGLGWFSILYYSDNNIFFYSFQSVVKVNHEFPDNPQVNFNGCSMVNQQDLCKRGKLSWCFKRYIFSQSVLFIL